MINEENITGAELATEDTGLAIVVENNEGSTNIIPIDKKKAAAGNAGVYVHKFKKPFEYEGKKYETLNFYFERLTGDDVITIENEMQANNEYALDPLLSKSFQCKMASRAGGVADNVLRALPIHEFNKITNAARSFLMDSGY